MTDRLDATPALHERVKGVWPRSEEVVTLQRQSAGETLREVRGDRLNSKGDQQKRAEQRPAGGKEDRGGGRALSDPDPRNYKRDRGVDNPLPELSKASRPRIQTRAEFASKSPASVNPWQYETPLTPAEERDFRAWKQKYAPFDSGEDYDLRGAFKAGLKPDPKSGHWPDTYKKPNHPTFSNESKYAKDRPDLAGHWEGDKFVPPGARR